MRKLILLHTFLLLLSGCGTNPAPDPESATLISVEPVAEPSPETAACAVETADYDQMPAVANSIIVGLDSDMTSGCAQSGEAIRRGIVLAIEEINAAGGVLGRPLELVVRDHRGNPARGVDNIEEFAAMDRVVAIVGGVHTPVALEELKSIHEHELVYLGPWAAGTPVVANGYHPNYVFRVSVRDEFAGGFLVEQALARGYRRIGLLLEQTGWGRSNDSAIKKALKSANLTPAAVEWFHWGVDDLGPQIARLHEANADVIILVCNPLEGATAVHSMATLPPSVRLPIISHWGITAGDFRTLAQGDLSAVDLVLLQTFSFIKHSADDHSSAFVSRYCQRFPECQNARQIFSPVGTAHAYDLTRMLCRAIEQAGSTDRPKVREALEHLPRHRGLVRTYDPAFTSDRHDALSADDFCLARYAEDGTIVPLND